MRKLLIIILILMMLLIPGCLPPNRTDFSKRKYLRNSHHRQIPFYYQDKYKGPLIKSERKRALTKPSTINLDKW